MEVSWKLDLKLNVSKVWLESSVSLDLSFRVHKNPISTDAFLSNYFIERYYVILACLKNLIGYKYCSVY